MLMGVFEHGFHQLAADAFVLRVGIDGDGTDAVNNGALVEAVAAENLAVGFPPHRRRPVAGDPGFGNDAIEIGSCEASADDAAGHLENGYVAGEVVGGVDGGEGAEANVGADGNVLRSGGPDDEVGLGSRGHGRVLDGSGRSIAGRMYSG